MNRRRILMGTGAAVVAGLAAGAYVLSAKDRPLALVYRGPASCSDCSESVAALLQNTPSGFHTEFCGPKERQQISPETLAKAVVYAQPGGGSLDPAWHRMRGYANDIRDFVHNGGHYLGFCLGAYLAGRTPGFTLLPGDADEYTTTADATVRSADDTIIQVRWRGHPRHMYFQDGPVFRLRPGALATVLATYSGGAPAAAVAAYGSGWVGVVGPHPEADRSWYASSGLTNPDGIQFDLGYDLIESTVQGHAIEPSRSR
jgi:hypothetical protein